MTTPSRRDMLAGVGSGMLTAALGPTAAGLGLASARAADGPSRLTFGDLDALVGLVRDTPPSKILGVALEKLRTGTPLKRLVAAAALANARAFGGEDYVGFHTLMALTPSFHMAEEEVDTKRQPLAVLKVLYRNAARLGEVGHGHETLKPVDPAAGGTALRLRDELRKPDAAAAEKTFAGLATGTPQAALDDLMVAVDDATEVHRIVLVARSWDLIDFVGTANAHALLRQSVRYCAKSEAYPNHAKRYQDVRDLLPKLMEKHRLPVAAAARTMDDAWVDKFSNELFRATPAQAAELAAAALADGCDPAAVGEAVSLVANQLVLRDEGRVGGDKNKPVGSCHGDSIGVHASDSAHAWRTVARAGSPRTRAASLVLAAYQVARDRGERGGTFLTWEPYPRPAHRDAAKDVAADKLAGALTEAIRGREQGRAAALAARLGETPAGAKEAFTLLRAFAVSEDGALHAEKYYRTASEDYATGRTTFRTRHLAALARVSASAFGYPAPGMDKARELVG